MVNKVILIGNLGRDPEVRSTPSGQSVASFSLATNRRWKDRDGNRQDQTAATAAGARVQVAVTSTPAHPRTTTSRSDRGSSAVGQAALERVQQVQCRQGR